ncbi:MAG: ATP-grasp domain-containing protein [Lachnospiraceae bacterium]|nr:ATP-grasp domain-containing protein [Lachnospiraceae bacterium]
MSKLIWIGPRESDKEFTGDYFSGAVTLYGGRKPENKAFCLTKDYRINHNHITEEQTEFMVENELKLIRKDPFVEFMTYNPNLIYDCKEEIIKHTVCLNSESVMRFLDSKISFRKFAEKYVHTLHSELILGRDCRTENLQSKFSGYHKWIIQSDIASGGYQTFVMSRENEKSVVDKLSDEKLYLVSPYYEKNIPINIHAVIYDQEVLLTQGSVQVMGIDCERLLYRGADYIAYRDIEPGIIHQFLDDVEIICKEIQKLGYRGILGIDAIIVGDTACILEINNRFQASTILINKALQEKGLPSLHELNYEAFHRPYSELIDKEVLASLKIDYSIYAFIQDNRKYHVDNIHHIYKNEKDVIDYIDDGYISWQEAENDAYLFRLIFKTNIVSITEEKCVRLHPNIQGPDEKWFHDIVYNRDFKKIKISLLNQGIVLTKEVKNFLSSHGGMREGVYFSVDLVLNDKYIVNSPLGVKFVQLSPFKVAFENKQLFLYYYGEKICKVKIEFADAIAEQVTGRGIPISRICLLATDRLRLQNSDFCTFKEQHIPCRFCEAKYRDIEFSTEDIIEAFDHYLDASKKQFRHILIGGLSNHIGMEKEAICKLMKHIRAHSDMPIYLMCLPCINVSDIEEYVRLGVTEIGFNIEIFDRNLARKYMPGKGAIPLERYRLSLQKSVDLLGNKGAVRSAFVLGLESMESLLDGVEFVCKLGVAPIFSVFRPIPGTDMENVNPPENIWLLEAYEKAELICKKYGLQLGPDCPACQNNTLAFDRI